MVISNVIVEILFNFRLVFLLDITVCGTIGGDVTVDDVGGIDGAVGPAIGTRRVGATTITLATFG